MNFITNFVTIIQITITCPLWIHYAVKLWYISFTKGTTEEKKHALKWPQHTSLKPNKWHKIFFLRNVKRQLFLIIRLFDFLGWECKVIVCKKGFLSLLLFRRTKKTLIGGGKINSQKNQDQLWVMFERPHDIVKLK